MANIEDGNTYSSKWLNVSIGRTNGKSMETADG